jgi:hypothetical protein
MHRSTTATSQVKSRSFARASCLLFSKRNVKITCIYKNTNHQQMHKESFIINRNTLLHVSTLLGHLQGEIFCYHWTAVQAWTAESSRLQKQGSTQSTAHSHSTIKSNLSVNGNKEVLPEDDPTGSKHVGVCYGWWQNSLCAFVGD